MTKEVFVADDKDTRIAALERKVAELERANTPPPPPPDWTPPPNPIDRLSMDRSVMREMAKACPDSFVKDIVGDHRAPPGPSMSGVPSSQQLSNVRGAGRGTGWSEPTPLSNPPGTRLIDAIAIADEVRQRGKK
jgi:hypothetical protein